MKKTLIKFNIMLFLIFFACTATIDKVYREFDEKLISEYMTIKLEFEQSKIDQLTYLHKLLIITAKEDSLEKEVLNHKFDNIAEYNYWHRGKLKFPSMIKLEVFRMQSLQ